MENQRVSGPEMLLTPLVCRTSMWEEPPFDFESTPVIVRIKGARVRAWQGVPDITVDNSSQVEVLAAAPWGEDVDLANNFVRLN